MGNEIHQNDDVCRVKNEQALYHLEIPEFQALGSETKESIQKCRAQVITQKIGRDLQKKFLEQKLPFDVQKFHQDLEKKVTLVLTNSQIPEQAKQKFLKDIEEKFQRISTISPQDIESLRTRRNIESLGMEAWEVSQEFGNDDAKKQAYYLQKILESSINAYVSGASLGLEKAFSSEKQKLGTYQYDAQNLKDLFQSVEQLDQRYGLQIHQTLQQIAQQENLSESQLYRRCGLIIAQTLGKTYKIADTSRVMDFIKNGVLTSRAKSTLTEFQKDGKKEDVVDAVLGYKEIFTRFQGKENETKQAKEVAENNGFISKTKDFLGAERLESDFSYIEPTDIEERVKKLKMADVVILATQLVQISPIIGDIGGGMDGLYSAYSGINVQGEKLSTLERVINSVFGLLGVTIVGGVIAKALKAKQFAKIATTLKKIIPLLKQKVEEMLPNLPKELVDKITPIFLSLGVTLSHQAVASVRSTTEVGDVSTLGAKPQFAQATRWRTKQGEIPVHVVENAKLSDIKDDVLKVGEHTFAVSPRMKKLYLEIQHLEEIKSMTPKQIEETLEAIQIGHNLHSDVSIGQHSQNQIIEKWKAARKGGASDDIIRYALENGYMGSVGINRQIFSGGILESRAILDTLKAQKIITDPVQKVENFMALLGKQTSDGILSLLRNPTYILPPELHREIASGVQKILGSTDIRLFKPNATNEEILQAIEEIVRTRGSLALRRAQIEKNPLLGKLDGVRNGRGSNGGEIRVRKTMRDVEEFVGKMMKEKMINDFQKGNMMKAFEELKTGYFSSPEGIVFVRDNDMFVLSHAQLKNAGIDYKELGTAHNTFQFVPDFFRTAHKILFAK